MVFGKPEMAKGSLETEVTSNRPRQCHICRSDQYVRRLYDRTCLVSGELYRCQRCRLAFFVSREEHAETDDNYWRHDVNIAVYSRGPVIDELEKKYAFYMGELKKRGVAGVRLLDVGCGTGIFLHLSRKLGFAPTGIDISTKAVKYTNQHYNLNAHAGLLEESSFAPGSFDVITLWDVIEHVKDPRALLAKANDLLSKKGVLIVETPDERALLRRVIEVTHAISAGHFNYLPLIYYPDHRWYFSRRSLAALLEEVGYSDVAFYREATMMEKAKGKRDAYGPRRRTPSDVLAILAMKVMRRVPWLGNKIVAYATKR